ncbi:MAG: hypothetical protein E7221_01535 [Clostridiales bacterium]|nr:hypothetical protein [Clostridiales bacterium]
MNRNELPYFNIGRSYGGNQRWFLDFWMHIGGCGALTMCDLMIYMAMFRDIPEGIPFNAARLTRREYVRFGMQMKPYLKPRKTGIKDLKTFIDGADDYLRSSGIRGIEMEEFPGTETYAMAERVLKEQIDAGMPVPMLMLNHKRKEYSFFEWHWFLLVGYEDRQEGNQTVTYAKAATYGKAHWLRFDRFWETGMEERGGLIIVKEKHQ